MSRQLAMWALLCFTAPFVCAQKTPTTDLTPLDTIEYSVSSKSLNEIVVTASPVINKTDRKVIRPNKEILNSSSDGIDLLRKLQLAWISVNPLTNEIVVAGGGTVVLCINGVESSAAQISAIRPEDIRRIEYHDSPGVRYAGASAVIDYITMHHDAGGNLMLDAFGAFASGRYASIDHFAGQYNCGRSAWNVNVGFMGQQKDKWIRDYEETWHYPNSIVSRKETGMPVEVGQSGLESVVNYNYLHPRGDMFNLRLGFDFNDIPNMEQGDRHALLETSVSDVPVILTEHTEEHSIRPNIGLYYLHNIGDDGNMTIDLQGSCMRSRMMHEYVENGIRESNRVSGNKYSIKFLGMYENRKGSQVWNVGISNNSSAIHNVYHQSRPVRADVIQAQSALIGGYTNRFGNWGAMFDVRAAYNNLKHNGRSIDRFFLLPAVTISYRFADKYFLRYAVSLDYVMPAASEISDVTQPVQSGMIRRGNPGLKPFRVIDQSFTASFEWRLIGIETRIEYRNEHSPIMESVVSGSNGFVKTYFNQRSFQRFRAGASLSVRPWKDHLSISVEPVLNRYFSHGIDYSHCHNISRMGLSVDFRYGNWLAYGNVMSGPENKMYGEEIIEEKDMNQIMVGYKRDKWSIHLGVFNAFMRDYWMETRNLSALAPYISKAHSDRNSSYVAVKFNLALDFGRKGRNVDVPENTLDDDSGILKGTK